MRKDKEKIVNLRKQGKSYKEISRLIGVSKSTLSGWFKGENWSKSLKEDLQRKATIQNVIRLRELNKVRGERLDELYREAREEAELDCKIYKDTPLFISGVMIYWGEGDKVSKNNFRISNSDPSLVRLFVRFLLEICNVKREKIRASLLIYPDIIEKEAKDYWIQNSGLKYDQFTKSIVIKGRHKTKRLPGGVCIIVVSSTYLKEKMLVWLKLLPQMIR